MRLAAYSICDRVNEFVGSCASSVAHQYDDTCTVYTNNVIKCMTVADHNLMFINKVRHAQDVLVGKRQLEGK